MRSANLQKKADGISRQFGIELTVAERVDDFNRATVFQVRSNGKPLMGFWRNESHTSGHLDTIRRTLIAAFAIAQEGK